MDFLNKAKDKAVAATQTAAAATNKAAKQASIKTEIAFISQQLKSAKQQFGVDVWASLATNGWNKDAEAVFQAAKMKVDELENKLQQKEAELEAVNKT